MRRSHVYSGGDTTPVAYGDGAIASERQQHCADCQPSMERAHCSIAATANVWLLLSCQEFANQSLKHKHSYKIGQQEASEAYIYKNEKLSYGQYDGIGLEIDV